MGRSTPWALDHRRLVVGFWVVLALAGCGGGTATTTVQQTTTTPSSGHGKAAKQVTFPAYAGFPATTETITSGTPARCRLDAKGFTHNAVRFLTPSTSPVDVYLIGARTAFLDFVAHRCGVTYLREPLSRRLTATQRRRLVEGFTFMGKLGHELSPKAPRK
jgi:hypothetical protein